MGLNTLTLGMEPGPSGGWVGPASRRRREHHDFTKEMGQTSPPSVLGLQEGSSKLAWGGGGGRRGCEALGKILKDNALSSSFLLFSFNLKVICTGKPLHVLPSPPGLPLDVFT